MATLWMYYVLSAYISAKTYTSAFIKAYLWLLSNGQGSWTPSAYPVTTAVTDSSSCQKVCTQDTCTSILILDNKVYLKRANYAYPLAQTMIQRSTECQYKRIGKPTHFTFGLHFDGHGWYVLCLSYDTVVAMIHYWRNGRSEFLVLVVPYWLMKSMNSVSR